MSRKDTVNSLFLKRPDPEAAKPQKSGERVRTGAISAMGASLHEMSENAKHAANLQKQLAEGEAVLSLDVAKIDSSRVADRIPIEVDAAFDQLVASIEENGQQVPILVRPHPDVAGRYQIAYGRRRLRAAEVLGRSVKAIVKTLSDSELIVAQGRENLDRKDLSFIEKAFFAKNLEDDGCDRRTIVAALGTDKADVSRYILVARRVPEDIVRKIGPAPKAGRARWLALADALEKQSQINVVEDALEGATLRKADSDTRLNAALQALAGKPRKNLASKDLWKAPNGKRAAHIEARDGRTALVFEDKVVPDFARFISARLDQLYVEFQADGKEGES